jgi:hypothetical protein
MGGKYMVVGGVGVTGVGDDASLLQEDKTIPSKTAANKDFIIEVEYFRLVLSAEV